jgi:hypothetical protein
MTFRRAPAEPLPPELHRLGRFALVGHHPCTPACAPSLDGARAILARIAALDSRAVLELEDRLAKPVLLVDTNTRAEVEGQWVGREVAVERFTPLDGAAFPAGATSAVRILVSRTRIALDLGSGTRVELAADRPLLSSPGAALAPAALEAIGGPAPASGVTALPELPASFRRGTRVHAYRIGSVERSPAEATIELLGPAHRFVVRLRAWDPARPWTVRRGQWTIDVDDAPTLPDPARAALAILVRALPP